VGEAGLLQAEGLAAGAGADLQAGQVRHGSTLYR
jgi:hypothetical protein